MIRTICLAFLGMLVFCGTSHADYLIDNFSMLDTPNSGGGTSAAGDHGGAVTAEVTSSTGVGVTASGGTGVYSFNASPGDMLSIFYDWAGVYEDLPGHVFIRREARLGGISFPGDPPSIIPVDVLTGSLSDWSMLIDAPGGDTAVYNATENNLVDPLPAHSLIGSTSLEFKFTYMGVGTSFIQFGGQDLTAVPEPTTLLMFGSVVALGFSRRRRR